MIIDSTRKQLAQVAIQRAMQIRSAAKIPLLAPSSPVDACERLGLAVWFSDIPSMEGFYLPEAKPKPAVMVSTLRPRGRQSMTCGHELGHHAFGHGEQWDELVDQRAESRKFDPAEYQADLFSACFHMPKLAVCNALKNRKLDVTNCSPEQIYELSVWFGVGYATIIHHLARTLSLIGRYRANELLKYKPRDIRHELLGRDCPQHLVLVDHHWTYRPIDLQVGDIVLLPKQSEIEGTCAIERGINGKLLEVTAVRPGLGRVSNESLNWAAYVRVSRKNYVGRSIFRFDEEIADD